MKGQEIRRGLKTAEEDVRVSPMLRARTLRAMRESGKPKTGRAKKKASFVLAAALVCVMLTAVALAAANRAGMLDFIGRYPNAELPDNARLCASGGCGGKDRGAVRACQGRIL